MSYDNWCQSYDLGPEDILRYPIWVTVSDGDVQEAEDNDIDDADEERDEATCRPKTVFGGSGSKQAVSFDDAALVGCTIHLGDGSEHIGFVWHDDAKEWYGLTLVTAEWHTPIAPTHGVGISKATGVNQGKVFPIQYESLVAIKEDSERGSPSAVLKGVIEGA